MVRTKPHVTLADFARQQNMRAWHSEARAARWRGFWCWFDGAVAPQLLWRGGFAGLATITAGIIVWRILA